MVNAREQKIIARMRRLREEGLSYRGSPTGRGRHPTEAGQAVDSHDGQDYLGEGRRVARRGPGLAPDWPTFHPPRPAAAILTWTSVSNGVPA